MRPILEHLPPLIADEPVACEIVRGGDFGCVWHLHPECEITLVLKGGTERLVGERLAPLKPGDLVFLGPNVPHDFRNQPAPGRARTTVEAVVVQFRPQGVLSDGCLRSAPLAALRRLFQRSAQGLEVTGGTRRAAAAIMRRMPQERGLGRMVLLLRLLDLLAESDEVAEISAPLPGLPGAAALDRMGRACAHIAAHLAEPVYVAQLAAMTGLGVSAFSRLFKKSTGRTVPQYVNELRIARACGLLAETDLTVGQIAAECGFVSPAHFQRQFQRHQRCAPTAYRSRLGFAA